MTRQPAPWPPMRRALACLGIALLLASCRDPSDLLKPARIAAPVARFTVTPKVGGTSTQFVVDASACSDSTDPVSSLVVRWDWEDDGEWDTPYRTQKTDVHSYQVTGTPTIRLEVMNKSGAQSTAAQAVLVSDRPPPRAAFAVQPDAGLVTTTFQFDASGSSDAQDSIAALVVRWDWESDGTWDADYTRSKAMTHRYGSPGRKLVVLEVMNTLGLTARATHALNVVNTPPRAAFALRPTSGTTDTLFTVDASGCTDLEDDLAGLPLQVVLQWGDGQESTGPASRLLTHRYATPGQRTVELRVKDSGGLESSASVGVQVVVGANLAPAAHFVVTPSSGTVETNFVVDASTSTDPDDVADSLRVRWDWENDGLYDTAYSSIKTSLHRYASLGTKTIRLEVVDPHGATGQATRQIVVENTAPTASFTVSADSRPMYADFTFDATGCTDLEDQPSALEVRWDWDADGNWDTEYTHDRVAKHHYDRPGTKSVALQVRDSQGATGRANRTVQVTNTPPKAAFTLRPTSGTTDSLFTVDASRCTDLEDDLAGLPLQVVLQWGDGQESTGPANRLLTHRYATPGQRTVELRVKDSVGLESSASAGLQVVRPNLAPTALFVVAPSSGTVETKFAVDASTSTDPDDVADSLRVRWDWENDGLYDTAYSSIKTSLHRYASLGTKTIRLEVVDPHGATNQATRQIVVENTPPTASFTVSADSRPMYADFTFDATGCTDLEDQPSALEVRWDWDADGNWDTEYTHDGVAKHHYDRQGTKSVALQVRDSQGATGRASRTVQVTNTPPKAAFALRPTSGTTDTLFTVDASGCTDLEDDLAGLPLQVVLQWGDGQESTGLATRLLTHRYATPGPRTVELRVKDSVGLESSASAGLQVVRPNMAPTALFVVAPSSGTVETKFAVDASTSTDPDDVVDSLRVRWDWENDGLYDTAYSSIKTSSHRYASPGTKTIRLEVVDPHRATNQATRQIVVENTAPTASFTVSADSRPMHADFTFDATGCTDLEDQPSALEVRWDWDADGNWDTEYTHERTAKHHYDRPGTKSVAMQVRDSQGAAGRVSRTVQVTNTPPQLGFQLRADSLSEDGYTRRTLLALDASSSRDLEDDSGHVPLQVAVNWGDGSPMSRGSADHPLTHQYAGLGLFSISVKVQDSAGLADSGSTGPVVIRNQQPVASFEVGPDSAQPSCPTYRVLATASDLEDDPRLLALVVTWGDGDSTRISNGERTASHRYRRSGRYLVTLEASDTEGAAARVERRIDAVRYQLPTASLAVTGVVACTVGFALTIADCEHDPPIVRVRWDWEGDGVWDTDYELVQGSVALRSWSYGPIRPRSLYATAEILDSREIPVQASTRVTLTACRP